MYYDYIELNEQLDILRHAEKLRTAYKADSGKELDINKAIDIVLSERINGTIMNELRLFRTDLRWMYGNAQSVEIKPTDRINPMDIYVKRE